MNIKILIRRLLGMQNSNWEFQEKSKVNPIKIQVGLVLNSSIVKEEFKQKYCLLLMLQKHFQKHLQFYVTGIKYNILRKEVINGNKKTFSKN